MSYSNIISSESADNLVFEFFNSAIDVVVQNRHCIMKPITSSYNYKDNDDFCKQAVQQWRRDITKPMILDIYIFDPRINKHILMERWKYLYQRQDDISDNAQISVLNRRMVVLGRAIYSFVRLLPGFNLLHLSAKPPTVSFQIYEKKHDYPTNFIYEYTSYEFNPVSTTRGKLGASVRFLAPHVIQVGCTSLH
jgi:hypothetical protein